MFGDAEAGGHVDLQKFHRDITCVERSRQRRGCDIFTHDEACRQRAYRQRRAIEARYLVRIERSRSPSPDLFTNDEASRQRRATGARYLDWIERSSSPDLFSHDEAYKQRRATEARYLDWIQRSSRPDISTLHEGYSQRRAIRAHYLDWIRQSSDPDIFTHDEVYSQRRATRRAQYLDDCRPQMSSFNNYQPLPPTQRTLDDAHEGRLHGGSGLRSGSSPEPRSPTPSLIVQHSSDASLGLKSASDKNHSRTRLSELNSAQHSTYGQGGARVQPRQESPSSGSISPPWSELSYISNDWDNSALAPIRHLIVERITSTFRTNYEKVEVHRNEDGVDGTRSHGAHHVGTTEATPKSGRSSRKQPAKRKRDSSKTRKGSDDDDDGSHRRTFRRSRSKELPDAEKLLACPFCKWNSRRYRKCYKYVLKDIARLKQHLARCHRIPIHCAVCFALFESEEARDDHLRERACEIRDAVKWEGANEKQRKQLEQRVSKKKTKEENWYIIYTILFPDERLPSNPYVHALLSEELCMLQHFIATEGPRVLTDLIRSELPDTLRPQEDETEAFLQTAFQDVVETLLAQWEARHQHERTTASTHESSFFDAAPGSGPGPGSGVESSITSRSRFDEDLPSLDLWSNFPTEQDEPAFPSDGTCTLSLLEPQTKPSGESGIGFKGLSGFGDEWSDLVVP